MLGKGQRGWRARFRRLMHGLSMPLDARVDPSLFPEDEFPVYCPSCDYLLRGLADNRCPECGEAFDRGRLLVEQYVLERGKRQWPRIHAWARWTFIIGLLLPVPMGCIGAALLAYVATTNPATVSRVAISLSWVALFPILWWFACAGLQTWLVLGSRRQSKQVRDRIDQDNPSFHRHSQWFKRIYTPILVVVAIGCTWRALGSNPSRTLHQYTHDPVLRWLAIALVVSVVLVELVGPRLWRWMRRPK